MTTLVGAGQILIEQYYSKVTKKYSFCFILVQDTHKKTTVMGGGYEAKDNKNLMRTAERELYEESCCLLKISPEKLSETFIMTNGKELTTVLCVEKHKIFSVDYENNKKIVLEKKMPYCYRETTELVRIPIEEVESALTSWDSKSRLSLKDANNKTRSVGAHAVKCLSLAIKKNLVNTAIEKPYKLKRVEDDGFVTLELA
jgi:hypothetical protein